MRRPHTYHFGQCPDSGGRNQAHVDISLCDMEADGFDRVRIETWFTVYLTARNARAAGKRLLAMADWLDSRKEAR